MTQLSGVPVAALLYEQIKKKIFSWPKTPCLAVVLVGNDPASAVYVSHKQKACEKLGFKSVRLQLPESADEQTLTDALTELNNNPDVDGILLQLPLPKPIRHLTKKMTNLISPSKDADALTAFSLGLLVEQSQNVVSCTPAGIIEILRHYKIDVSGQPVLVIGRSQIVGLPLFHLLNQKNATVTLAHSHTPNLKQLILQFDYVFVAVGRPHFLKATDFKKKAVVIDVGIHRTESGLCGDVDPVGAEEHLSALTPVPGGVGPMTIAMLMQNTYQLAERRRSL
jgi:methylenetetrahydrofolate dehydrogenase (NADP+)/methenyltetrahydrofolate cyclohydrolase